MNMETNKIFAALLVAGIIGMGAGFISKTLVPSSDAQAETMHQTEATIKTATTEATPVMAVVDGGKVFNKCKSCHTVNQGGKNLIGPNLHGVVDKARASNSTFAYSSAMKASGGKWTEKDLDGFLANPRKYISGNKMTFAGLKKPEERAAVIKWLKEQAK